MGKKDKIQEILQLSFKCDKEHWSNYGKDHLIEIGNAFTPILIKDNSYSELERLDQIGFFKVFIPELYALKLVPQNKQNSKDAFHHSLIVVKNVKTDHVLKWAALLHDIGKVHYKTGPNNEYDFRGHEFTGAKLAKSILKRMDISHSGDICRLIQFHTHPLDYQRQPNWKISTVKKFISKYEHLTMPLIDLAISDKIASSGQSSYLEELYKLKNMIEEILYQNDPQTV